METFNIPAVQPARITSSAAPCCGSTTSGDVCCDASASPQPKNEDAGALCCTPETKGKPGCC